MHRKAGANVPSKVAEFKVALATAMRLSSLPLKAQLSAMGVSPSTGYAYADPHDLDAIPSIPRLLLLLPALDHPAVSDYLAGLQGHLAVPLPSPQAGDLDGLAGMLEAFAALVKHHAAAVADGSISEMDAALYRERGTRLVRAVLGMTEYIDTQVGRAALSRKVTA